MYVNKLFLYTFKFIISGILINEMNSFVLSYEHSFILTILHNFIFIINTHLKTKKKKRHLKLICQCYVSLSDGLQFHYTTCVKFRCSKETYIFFIYTVWSILMFSLKNLDLIKNCSNKICLH